MIRFIVNPAAGAHKTKRRWHILEDYARKILDEFDVKFTRYPGHAIKLAKEAAESGIETVVAVGGDGTINEVANGIFYSNFKPKIGIIDCGTGADFVRTVPVGKNYFEAIDTLKTGIPRKIDLVEVEFEDFEGVRRKRVFVNAADAGLGGDTVINVDGAPKVMGGKLAFLYGVLRSLVNLKNYTVKINLDGRDLGEYDIISVVVANGRYFAGGMFVAPMAKPDDGRFELVIIKNTTRRKFLKSLPLVYKGKHIYIDEVEHFTGGVLELRSETDVMIEMDGELVGRLPARFEVKNKALEIITKK